MSVARWRWRDHGSEVVHRMQMGKRAVAQVVRCRVLSQIEGAAGQRGMLNEQGGDMSGKPIQNRPMGDLSDGSPGKKDAIQGGDPGFRKDVEPRRALLEMFDGVSVMTEELDEDMARGRGEQMMWDEQRFRRWRWRRGRSGGKARRRRAADGGPRGLPRGVARGQSLSPPGFCPERVEGGERARSRTMRSSRGKATTPERASGERMGGAKCLEGEGGRGSGARPEQSRARRVVVQGGKFAGTRVCT